MAFDVVTVLFQGIYTSHDQQDMKALCQFLCGTGKFLPWLTASGEKEQILFCALPYSRIYKSVTCFRIAF